MVGLFRREAVEQATSQLTGDVVLTSPRTLNLLCGGLLAIVLVTTAALGVAQFVRYETVSGRIVPNAGLIRVASRGDGVVSNVLVREDEPVQRGAPIVLIKRSSDLANGDAGALLMSALEDESVAGLAGIGAERQQLENRRAQISTKISDLRRELAESQERIKIGEQQAALAQGQVQRAEALRAQGFLSTAAVDLRRSTALSAADSLSQMRASALEYQKQINEAQREAANLPAALAGLNARSGQLRAAATQRRTTLETANAVTVTAPVAGRVAALPVDIGQSVSAGATLAVLTPAGSTMAAELYIPSRAAGFIRPGQKVRLMYQAFPYQTFGAGSGVVRTVSRTVLNPADAPSGLKISEPVFRARVDLDRPSVSAYGGTMPLQAGMLLEADIILDRRPLIAWLLDPLYAAGRRH